MRWIGSFSNHPQALLDLLDLLDIFGCWIEHSRQGCCGDCKALLAPLHLPRSFVSGTEAVDKIAFSTGITGYFVQGVLLSNLVPFRFVLVFSVDHVRFPSCGIFLATPLSHYRPLDNMSDPLFDALLASDPYTATALPAPLQPSRVATPLSTHSNTPPPPFRSPSISNNQTKDIEAERRADEAEALFDPLQGEQH